VGRVVSHEAWSKAASVNFDLIEREAGPADRKRNAGAGMYRRANVFERNSDQVIHLVGGGTCVLPLEDALGFEMKQYPGRGGQTDGRIVVAEVDT
jgi:hypothetical protein